MKPDLSQSTKKTNKQTNNQGNIKSFRPLGEMMKFDVMERAQNEVRTRAGSGSFGFQGQRFDFQGQNHARHRHRRSNPAQMLLPIEQNESTDSCARRFRSFFFTFFCFLFIFFPPFLPFF